MKILIVDDELDTLNSFNNILLPAKFEFKTTNDPLEAIDLVKKDNYDALILDVKMYPIDGLTLLKRIREFNSPIYVILITAYEEYSILESAINLHVFSFIKKPLDVKKLINTLREIENKVMILREKEEAFNKMEKEYKYLKDKFKKKSLNRGIE